MNVALFSEPDAAAWDALVLKAPMGTLLHTRRFLSYHGARYQDQSLLFLDEDGTLMAVLPAATDPHDHACVVSHPGATYGGLIYEGRKEAALAIKLLSAARDCYSRMGFTRMMYKPVPPHLHMGMYQADLYALWRLQAQLVRRDLWNVIDLSLAPALTGPRERQLRAARRAGIRVRKDDSDDAYRSFHRILTQSLIERHGATPIHTAEEMRSLHLRFPEEIHLLMASDEIEDLAGVWLFKLEGVHHAQYFAASPAGFKAYAQTILNSAAIETASRAGSRFFSMGASTAEGGEVLNIGLFEYKASFGPGCVAQDVYRLELRADGSNDGQLPT